MKNTAIFLALASTALATPALARDGSWYVGVEGGPTLVESQTYTVTSTTDATRGSTDSAKYKGGANVDGIIGYDFGGFRLEGEVGYQRAGIKSLSATGVTPFAVAGGAFSGIAPAGTFTYAGGNTSVLSFMLNGLLDFGPDDGLQGFVGGGVGVARVKSQIGLNTYGNFLNDSNSVFAWQAIAGVRAPLSKHLDVGLKYRYFNASGINYVDAVGDAVNTKYRSHSLMGSLIYNFGGKEAPPPPPPVVAPPPPPPPPPPVVVAPPPPPVCAPGPYIVFFEWDKSDITPEAASVLDGAVSAYGNCGQAKVMLAGYTDLSGGVKYNLKLSQRRDDSVQAYLTNKGIPAGVITSQAFGKTNPRVPTADGVRELQNRRVEINYGPGSGN